MPEFPDLPVRECLPRLLEVLEAGRNAVLVAPPGAGKTTTVPLALMAAEFAAGQKIVMLEPRRLAARAAATRMSALIGEAVGQSVGYRTRLDSAVSAATRVEVVTEGLLVRRLQSDPGLEGVAAVIFDEVHERALDADLALAFCLDLQRELRPELRILAMSATADGARLGPLLDAEIVESAGRMFPVAVSHGKRDIVAARDLPDAMARAIRAALAEHKGDILAFLPGMGEIRRTETALQGCGALVLPLHGDLPPAEQDRALRPAEEGRRVVLATSIAETSLTVPGVRIVVDGGWRRAPRLDAGTGLTRLDTMRISRAAAAQRAGRAGREAPGVAIRLWTEAQHRGLAEFDRPEILEAELSGLALDCAAWGTEPSDLPFPDPPPAGPLAAARELLTELGALNTGRISPLGRRMAQLGAHPRLAAMMLAAQSRDEAAMACDIAALLEERDPLRDSGSADIGLRLEALETGAGERGVVSRVRRAALQYRRRLGLQAQLRGEGDAGRLIAAGFPDRVAQRRGEPGSFRLSGGGGAKLPTSDKLANAKLLAVAALEMKLSAQIRLAAPLDAAHLWPRSTVQVETGLDTATGSVLARRRRRYGALILEDRTEAADPAETALALANAANFDALPWSDAARQLQARVAILHGLEPDAWPDFSNQAFSANRQWLADHLHGVSRLAWLDRLDLHEILRAGLAWEQTSRLDRELPTHLQLPGGRASVDYTQPVPLAEARAQFFYGMAETPKLAGGRVELRLALLSPAQRPVAITADLAGFWNGAWADVRKDMRGRYPRHHWPEDPATASARKSS
jgi:ATP-dependent helicase HrpB